MPEPFRPLSLSQFAHFVEVFPFRRRIESVHLHHTWRPNHAQYFQNGGLKTIRGMARHHRSLGWSDIAQHISIAPDPAEPIWTGRNWNAAPASASGFNGNVHAGPFMIEMIGDFDEGKDRFEGQQRETVIDAVNHLLARFELPVEAVRFHNQMTSQKSCPGTAIDRDAFLQALEDAQARTLASRSAFDSNAIAAARDVIEMTFPDTRAVAEQPEAELREVLEWVSYEDDDAARGEQRLTPAMQDALSLHIVNMRRGRFMTDQFFHSSPGTVDAIFTALDARAKTASPAKPVRIVFWAHGGLVGPEGALIKAHHDLQWWESNDVFPISFIWHTDLGTAIKDILIRVRQRITGRRDVWDYTTDPIIEGLARMLGGEAVWGSMKLSAAEGVQPSYGASGYVAKRLGAIWKKYKDRLQVHAVGHSAGSIFHSHFIPAAVEEGVKFKTLQFLAPAILTEEYKARLDLLVGKAVDHATIFTMKRPYERDDQCIGIYRKSLLYLIKNALEDIDRPPLLGLEESLRDDQRLATRFGLSAVSTVGDVVWSPTTAAPPGASTSTAHGCFDDDEPTMNSVISRILGGNQPMTNYISSSKDCRNAIFAGESAVPRELEMFFAQPMAETAAHVPQAGDDSRAAAPARGKRTALCVGIDVYPTAPLRGCVADARLWSTNLRSLGFDTTLLLNEKATRSGILDALDRLLRTSKAGDVVVLQYSGHGTEVPDLDRDEPGGRDQALCPYDFASGKLLIDDDIADVFLTLPQGVSFTCFLDCCHSGTATRFAVGVFAARSGGDERMRFLQLDDDVIEQHVQFRHSIGKRAVTANRGPDFMREVVFSACRPDEVAWESNGQGDFTRNAVPLLKRLSTLTNQQFQDLITSGFKPVGRQHPILDCAPATRHTPVFGGAAPQRTGPEPAEPGGPSVAALLRQMADVVERQ